MTQQKSNLELHAENELRIAGLFDKDSDYGGMLGDATMKLIKVFSEEGHSGFSANLAIQLFSTLAKYEPLTPLQGTDDEWFEPMEGYWQNKRCSHVFKDKDGKAYDIEAKVFREPDGSCWAGRDSRVYIEFPYTPKREYVDAPTKGTPQ